MTSRSYLAFIRSLPCLVCGIRRGIEACHTGGRGLGQKSSDLSCIPLCRQHHRIGNDSYHRLGSRRFAELHGLDIPELVGRLNGMGTAGLKLHGPGRKELTPEFTRARCLCGWRSAWYRMDADSSSALHSHIGLLEEKNDETHTRSARPRTPALPPGRKQPARQTAADSVDDLLRVAGF